MMKYSENEIKTKEFSGKYITCSALGENHAIRGMENQDSLGVFANEDSIVFAVADGLGSCKLSKQGSEAAIAVIEDCFQTGIFKLSEEQIESEIIDRWKSRVGVPCNDYSTTLRFVFVQSSRVIVGDIGDGLTLLDDGSFIQRTSNSWFANCTDALSDVVSHFKIISNQLSSDRVRLMIMSDGVANDIRPGCEAGLLEYISELLYKPDCRKEIDDWIETIGTNNGDDKTFVVAELKRES